MPVMIVNRVPSMPAAASYGQKRFTSRNLHTKSCYQGSWQCLGSVCSGTPISLVEVMQPSVPILWYELPLPDGTTNMLPVLSNWMRRGLVKPPAIFVAFHPEARLPWKRRNACWLFNSAARQFGRLSSSSLDTNRHTPSGEIGINVQGSATILTLSNL